MIRKKDIEKIIHDLSNEYGYLDKLEFQRRVARLKDLSINRVKNELRVKYKQNHIIKNARDIRNNLRSYQNSIRTHKTILFNGERYAEDTIINTTLSGLHKISNVVFTLHEIATILKVSDTTASRLVDIGIIERIEVGRAEIEGIIYSFRYLYILDKTRDNLQKYIDVINIG